MDHIVHRYHEPVRKELQRLESLSAKVAQRHGEAFPQVLQIQRPIASLHRDMELHMVKEERVLFPLIKRLDATLGRGMTDRSAANQLLPPLRLMLTDHDGIMNFVRALRQQSDGYSVPDGVSASYHMLCSGLRGLQYEFRSTCPRKQRAVWCGARHARRLRSVNGRHRRSLRRVTALLRSPPCLGRKWVDVLFLIPVAASAGGR